MSRPILGIESSCDETAAALVTPDGRVLASEISSQVAIHHEFGGVVPELASRHHVLNIVPVVRQVLGQWGEPLASVAGIAVTRGPGLVGALLVGLQFAKSLSWVSGRPLVGVDHLRAHLEAPFLRLADEPEPVPPFPHVFLLVSGGHTVVGLRAEPEALDIYGATRDDAAGEAFDKVAKMLGLGYPGGVVIDQRARAGDRKAFRFPRAMLNRPGSDFSFSGLKTAVRQQLARDGVPEEDAALADLCASFQEAVVDVLVTRVRQAAKRAGVQDVVVAGGVAANSRLRGRLQEIAPNDGLTVHLPKPVFCTDNAAMVAFAGHRRLARGEHDDFDLNAVASWGGRLS